MAWKNGEVRIKSRLSKRRREAVASGLEKAGILRELRGTLRHIWADILNNNTYETKEECRTLMLCLQDEGILPVLKRFDPKRDRMPPDRIETYVPIAVKRNLKQIVDTFSTKFPLLTVSVEPKKIKYQRFIGGTAEITMPPVHSTIDIGMPDIFQTGEYTIAFDGFAGLIGYAGYKMEQGEEEYETKIFPRWIPNPFWQHVSKTAQEELR